MKLCKHAELIRQYGEDCMKYERPWKMYQVKMYQVEEWVDLRVHPQWHADCEYRRKPETIRIGDWELPMYLTVEPETGTRVWGFASDRARGFDDWLYNRTAGYLHAMFKNGALHSSEENVKEWVKWWKSVVMGKR